MPYLYVEHADGSDEVINVSTEVRLDIAPGDARTFDTETGLVSAKISDDRPQTKAEKQAEKEAAEAEEAAAKPKSKAKK